MSASTLARTDEARGLLRELEQLRMQGQAPPTAFAGIHAGSGEIDAAFEWLETAYWIRDGSLFWLSGAPGLDPLHADHASPISSVGWASLRFTTPDRRRRS